MALDDIIGATWLAMAAALVFGVVRAVGIVDWPWVWGLAPGPILCAPIVVAHLITLRRDKWLKAVSSE